jgi:MATE family multidrug resistance protein
VIYVLALWGVGLGGGYALAFNLGGAVPSAWRGARGYWIASTSGLTLAAVALASLLAWVLAQQRRRRMATGGATPVKPAADLPAG